MTGDSDRRGLSRRAFLSLGTGALLVAVTPAALRWRGGARLHRRTIPVMGTLAEVGVVEEDAAAARRAIEAAFSELRAVDATMSRFDAASEVGRLNRAPVGRPVEVSAATAGVVAAGLRWARLSGGRFDPALEGAVATWSVKDREAPPPEEAVRRWAGRDLWRELEVDGVGESGDVAVVRRDPDVGVDLGGIAKGYAVDRAVRALRAHGIRDGMVNAGGDLYALGLSPDGDPWQVGIRSPSDPTRLAGELSVSDRAVATSGDYEEYFEHGGRRYHHLLDPSTGAPRETGTVHSLTVTAGTCMAADAAATACFGLGRDEARRLLADVEPDVGLAGAGAGDRR